MKIRTQTRDVSPLSMRAALNSVNAEKRTVDVVFSTGAAVLRSNWSDGQFYEELSMDPKHVRLERLNNGAPFLADHNGSRVAGTLGVVESARIEGGKGIATIRFARAADDAEADVIFRKIADGIIQNVSVGYRINAMEKVEGGDGKIPTFRATDWTPFEISAVAMGADDAAGFRSANAAELNKCLFTSRTTETGMTPEELAKIEADKAGIEQRAAELKTATIAAALKAERERSSGIRAACRAAGMDAAAAEKMINDGVELDAARSLVIDDMAKRSDAFKTDARGSGIERGADAKDKFVIGATASLFSRAGAVELLKRTDPKIETDPGEFRSFGVMDIARECLERGGVKTRGLSNQKVAELAMTQRSSGYAATGDFPVLFESVLHKLLLGNYQVTPDTWSRICKQSTVPDFRVSNRYRGGSFGVLDALTEHGEFQNKSIPDGAKTTIQLATYGNMIAVSRQMIINDDMGAFSDLASKFGRAAALSIEVEFYRQLALNSGLGPTQSDSQPFFHANRANVNATGSALSVAGLDADRVKMRAQKDQSSNEYLDLRPSILMIPVGLEMQAGVLNRSATDPTAGAIAGTPNGVAGLFSDILASPRMTASTTRRYLFAPKEFGTVEVAFLEGVGNAPVLETERGWRVDGVEWKLRLDFAIKFMDGKGAVTNAGV